MSPELHHIRLPAEWEPQDGVLLAWPHDGTAWSSRLDEARACFAAIGAAITQRETLLLAVADDHEAARAALAAAGAVPDRIRLAACPLDDTWARDFGPLTVDCGNHRRLLDFGFNGWGLKFRAENDNLATRRLHAGGHFGTTPLKTVGLVFEGGSIESDGGGTLLTTAQCLLSPNRNPHLKRGEIEAALIACLGARRILWLEHGHLQGDDTDAHVDTLARLCPDDTICYQACDDRDDEHFQALAAMANELKGLTTAAGRPFRLVPLPWPRPIHAADGHRLPATYANFLVVNGAVLVPTYGQHDRDALALRAVATCFPDREVVAIDCRVLIEEHGSLHCVTMQLPQGVLP